MAQWYYARGGQQHGPITSDEIGRLLTSGQLQSDDLVWHDGMAQWARVQTVQDRFLGNQTIPPPLPGSVDEEAGVPSALATQGTAAFPASNDLDHQNTASSPQFFVRTYSGGWKDSGPYTKQQVVEIVETRKCAVSDFVCQPGEGGFDWTRIMDIPWLFTRPTPKPPTSAEAASVPAEAAPQSTTAAPRSTPLRRCLGWLGTCERWFEADDRRIKVAIFGGLYGWVLLLATGALASSVIMMVVGALLALAVLGISDMVKGETGKSIPPLAFCCIVIGVTVFVGYLFGAVPWGGPKPLGQKEAAFRTLVHLYESRPQGDASIKEEKAHLEAVKKAQEEFIAIPFDIKSHRAEAKRIVELYFDKLYDVYSGALVEKLHDHIEPMWHELGDDVKMPKRLRDKWERELQSR